ncbi:hypothetical protein LEP1GSC036_2140 [Leptospira weilii str. 2006001853]|uniref:Uncharacterized protein n=4 Tax=Leptospira weilii TaxID=28184 RepID=A0A828YZD5_9LEPT|nr:hypothetical protein LEP1GSC036_2140 [Leptospira weilii str. 2006001853]EMJ60302.1 hypothetical protein LEP1GSC051_0288 [Leptospira sp. P2653]EMM72721.1 hypothetical protein LEP1GSC038_2047 [Leptospira weilii str. 2006001855]EMN43749.1 hypothetical protein LEP1GSC086_4427 [Leptospira weilii str. LNT 1234]EMN91437.1 hypothetical protein LEP1GSC108_0950 [Leptospira weilii str. UI 13098]EMY16358.1 hypothetical protein LEP1GSC043_0451 [Leptospira weilii str. Ecochallenge]
MEVPYAAGSTAASGIFFSPSFIFRDLVPLKKSPGYNFLEGFKDHTVYKRLGKIGKGSQ